MNFFKSVFSDPDPGQNSTEDEPSDEAPAGGGGGWSFDGLIKTISTKSESVIQTYRRDLEEFGSGLKKETEALREAAARAVKDLPGSLEAGASVAQESLESVGQAIDDLGSSVLRGTAEIISHGKEALLTIDGDPSDSSSQANPSSKRYSRFEAQVLAIQADPATFTEEPEDGDEFKKWKEGFKLEEKGEEIESLLYESSQLEGFVEKLVPSVLDFGTFWTRYFYRVHKLRLAEDARASLVKRVISREEEEEFLSWEVDDDDDEKEIQVEDGEKKEIVDKELDHGEEKKEIVDKELDHGEEKKEIVDKELDHGEEKKEIADKELDHGEENKEIVDKELDHGEEKNEIVEKVELSEENKPLQASKDENLEVVDNVVSVNNEAKAGDDQVPPMALETSQQASKQSSKQEELDLEWDEIEDLGEHDDKKISTSGGSPNKVDLRKRLSVAEDEDDLSWDIEDDDDDGPAKA